MWRILAQSSVEFGEDYSMPQEYSSGIASQWWHFIYSSGWMVYVPFMIWMAIYCARKDSEKSIWLWIILVFQPFGALVYFFVRFLPSVQFTTPRFLHKFTRGNDLRRLEIAAAQIGNAHQFVELGDLHKELGHWERAGQAYANALKKDPQSLPALWGAASVEFRQRQFQAAREKTRQILDRDFTYKFGDVSLLHGKSLCELKDMEAARTHLEEHIRRWRHPEALYLLAEILAGRGDVSAARNHLQSLIQDIDASPRAIARRFFFWKGRARRMLNKLT